MLSPLVPDVTRDGDRLFRELNAGRCGFSMIASTSVRQLRDTYLSAGRKRVNRVRNACVRAQSRQSGASLREERVELKVLAFTVIENRR